MLLVLFKYSIVLGAAHVFGQAKTGASEITTEHT
jgi:hypothetical protein